MNQNWRSRSANGRPIGASPPRPPLVLNIGVTGHRPAPEADRPTPDVEAMRLILKEVLSLIRNTVDGLAVAHAELFDLSTPGSDGGGRVRLISSLAEWGDQWAAEEALDLGLDLYTILPFAREEYARDFKGAALQGYRRLLGKAKASLELDGNPAEERRAEAYRAASHAVLQQSDLLVALWDGDTGRGIGGTAQAVDQALQSGVPVVWIRWMGRPGRWTVIDSPRWRLIEKESDLESDRRRLEEIVTSILLPPDIVQGCPKGEESSLRIAYGAEPKPDRGSLTLYWCRVIERLLFRPDSQRPHTEAVRKTMQQSTGSSSRSGSVKTERTLIDEVDRHYLPHFVWANQLSVSYARRYRASFVSNYLLGALAVTLALIGGWLLASPLVARDEAIVAMSSPIPSLESPHPPPMPPRESHSVVYASQWPVALEFIVIVVILFVTLKGRRNRWHERWIQYRCLAERLRLSRFLWMIGGWRQHTAMPGHLSGYGDPSNTWMYWHSRAVERAMGVPNVQIDGSWLEIIRRSIGDDLLQVQIDYHKLNAGRLGSVDRVLERVGGGFFFATLLACLFHLVLESRHVRIRYDLYLVSLNAALPAFGAAIAAIRSQGEFRRVSRRAEAMHRELSELWVRLASIPAQGSELRSQEMRMSAERIARLILNENLDWRIVFQDHPLSLPA